MVVGAISEGLNVIPRISCYLCTVNIRVPVLPFNVEPLMCFHALAVKLPPGAIVCSAEWPFAVIVNRLPIQHHHHIFVGVAAADGPAVNKLITSDVLLLFTQAAMVILVNHPRYCLEAPHKRQVGNRPSKVNGIPIFTCCPRCISTAINSPAVPISGRILGSSSACFVKLIPGF